MLKLVPHFHCPCITRPEPVRYRQHFQSFSVCSGQSRRISPNFYLIFPYSYQIGSGSGPNPVCYLSSCLSVTGNKRNVQFLGASSGIFCFEMSTDQHSSWQRRQLAGIVCSFTAWNITTNFTRFMGIAVPPVSICLQNYTAADSCIPKNLARYLITWCHFLFRTSLYVCSQLSKSQPQNNANVGKTSQKVAAIYESLPEFGKVQTRFSKGH